MSRMIRSIVAALVASLALAAGAAAQNASAAALKAAFLVNFAKFVEWPADVLSPDGGVAFCVSGDPRVADALDVLAAGHPLGDRGMRVLRPKIDGELRDCHILFVQGVDLKGAVDLLQQLKGSAVFTVSDDERFTALGAVANFFVEGTRMRFAINLQSAQRAHVQLSSRLLTLAKIVKDAPNAVQH
jgi:hypothetical protein